MMLTEPGTARKKWVSATTTTTQKTRLGVNVHDDVGSGIIFVFLLLLFT